MEQNFKLINGVEIPSIGFGTWQAEDGDTACKAVKEAIDKGYRHIDTAAFYKNEASIGMAIKKSNVARKDLFVTSKVWNTDRGYDNTLKAFDKSLSDLQLDYLDLYLIHWPATEHRFENWKEINGETWAALEKLLADGKVRAIGVSNFMPHHLKPLLETAKVQPMVNQIEFHPGYTQHECVDFCKEHNIVIEAWSPLGTGAVLNNHILMSIAHKYQKSVAQICLRWVLQHGVLPIVKSVTPKRIEENIEIFDFVISNDDMKLINNITNCGGICQHPDKINF